MKICFISPYPPKKCGIATYTTKLVQGFSDQGLRVSLIPINKPADLLPLYSKLKSIKPDLIRLEFALSIYGVDSLWILFVLSVYKLKTKAKLVISLHEVKREIDILGLVGQIFFSLTAKLFDRVYVHTKEAKTTLTQQCKVKPSTIQVVPLGTFDFGSVKNYQNQLNKIFEINNKQVILYFGYIHVDKGIQYLLRACQILFKNHPNLKRQVVILIAGEVRPRVGIFKLFEKKDQDYFMSLKKLVTKLGLNEYVKFTGYVNDKHRYSIFKLARMVVLPYTNVEQSGVLNMALAIPVPVIASNIGGLKETIQGSGVLVPPKDPEAIAKSLWLLLQDKTLTTKLIQGYQRINQQQSTRRITRILIADFQQLIKS
jgi:glycosyltransferase involved in cell wall biosynthesis